MLPGSRASRSCPSTPHRHHPMHQWSSFFDREAAKQSRSRYSGEQNEPRLDDFGVSNDRVLVWSKSHVKEASGEKVEMTALFVVTSCSMTQFFRDDTQVVVGCAVSFSEAASHNIENQVVHDHCSLVCARSIANEPCEPLTHNIERLSLAQCF